IVGWSDLLKLVEASGEGGPGYVDIVDTSSTEPKRFRLSDLSDVKIGNSFVTAKVSRQNLIPGTTRGKNGEKEFVPSSADKDKGIELHVERLAEEKQLSELLKKKGLDWSNAGPPNPLLNYIP